MEFGRFRFFIHVDNRGQTVFFLSIVVVQSVNYIDDENGNGLNDAGVTITCAFTEVDD
jgi:hypothetical protein